MMSPVAGPYTPPTNLFVPTPSPLQYVTNPNARNDFLANSPLPYSSPFAVPAHYAQPSPYAANSNFQQTQAPAQMPSITVSVDNTHHLPDPLADTHVQGTSSSGPTDASLLLSLATDHFPYMSAPAPNSSSSTSPISHGGSPLPFQTLTGPIGEGESTPVTTLTGADESQERTQASAQKSGQMHTLIDRLRGASPITETSMSVSGSPERPTNAQAKPIESIESPFRIAAPQPRQGSGPFSPLPPSSRPSSALGALSELAEIASRQPTPSHPLSRSTVASPAPQSHPPSRPVSRPASALSVRSTASHAKPPKVRRKQIPPHRFSPSLLRVQLPYQQTPAPGSEGIANGKPITPSFVDGLARGPLEFEEEGHRYRTRSKLRTLKAEIQEREREADLLLIRRGLRGENTSANAAENGGLDMLASVSVTRRIELNSPRRAETPLSGQSQNQKATRPKRAMKRAFKDIDDGDSESVATSSDCGSRTPSKRPRIATEKVALAKAKKDLSEIKTLRSHASLEKTSARPSPVRTLSKKAASSGKSSRASSASAAVKKTENDEMDVDESELSSLSSTSSEVEDAKSSNEDADYAPKKSARSARTKAAPTSASVAKTSASKSSLQTFRCTPVSRCCIASSLCVDTQIRVRSPLHPMGALRLLPRRIPHPKMKMGCWLPLHPGTSICLALQRICIRPAS
ncbi:uncharacterized protein FOMMEDRAFT_23011 [Fomitiporia mediterranea MF3/22]|uniref:uncharacterized protein n=1 Tax=Fomitiporia mediterranea (strain MF3/22) TaxID=694068 RepID=UPI0004408B88|nr:uncharacterized protein FOMMEDRAFT_23011 [Fomitiporia mediterranea MF3/22]EJC99554.1 hypothetical protein FOMMEDRAFT_23011 [Fomitiporia mediterranea MF3/22]